MTTTLLNEGDPTILSVKKRGMISQQNAAKLSRNGLVENPKSSTKDHYDIMSIRNKTAFAKTRTDQF